MSDLATVTSAATLAGTPAPSDERLWLAQLPEQERRLVQRRMTAMQIIDRTRDAAGRVNVNGGAKHAFLTLGAIKGFSVKNLSRSYRIWTSHNRDDRSLADWAKHPWLRDAVEGRPESTPTRLAAPLIEHVGGLFLKHKRSMGAAYRELIQSWQASWHTGEKLPGIITRGAPGSARDYWRERGGINLLQRDTCPPDLPPGWTKSNLQRAVLAWCEITPAELALARRGTTAMRDHLPTIHTTRADLPFGLHLFTDDLQHDYEVVAPSGSDPFARPMEIGILELASAFYGPFVSQAAVRDELTDKRLGLGWENVKFAFGLWLEQNGVPLDHPLYLHVERGTATVHPDEAKFWHDFSGGLINICYTSMQGKYCLAWDEKRVGNFRGKAALESIWNLHHNYADSLPGYIGRNRDNCPAITHGQKRETLALLQWAASQPLAVRADLQLPHLTWDEWLAEREDQIARINTRTDHNLEAFDKVTLWRPRDLGADWRPLAELDKIPQKMRTAEFIETTTRLESPLERRARLRNPARWSACPHHWLAMIYGFRARKMTVAKGTIHIERGTAHWYFMAESKAAQIAAGIEDGKEYTVCFNPHSMTECHVLDAKGAYMATWICRVSRRGDKADAAKSFAHRQGWQREVEQKVERLLLASGTIQDTELRRAHNRQLGVPADVAGRISLSASSKSHTDAGTAGNGSPSEPEIITDGAQARPFPDPNAAVTQPLPSAPTDSAATVSLPSSGAETVAPALPAADRVLTHAPQPISIATGDRFAQSPSQQIAAAQRRVRRDQADDLDAANARAARQRARVKRLSAIYAEED